MPLDRLEMECEAYQEDNIESLMDELKAVAFEILLLNPGSEYGDWEYQLIHNYHTEVIDVYGNDPEEVYSSLRNLWEDDYCDTASDLTRTFKEWAQIFCNEEVVAFYYDCVEKIT